MRRTHSLGAHRRRLILCRQVLASPDATREEVATWPDPAWGTSEFWASVDSLTAGETIAQGLRQTEESQRLRVCRGFPGRAVDRVRDKRTGTLFDVRAVSHEDFDTAITLERVSRDPGVLLDDNGRPVLLDQGGFILLEG